MEILAEGRDWLPFIFLIGVATFIIVGTGFGFISGIRDCFNDLKSNILGTVLAGLACIILTVGLIGLLQSADEFDYLKVKITDHNVMYEQGYKIDSREGEIFKISKRVGE